MLSPLIKWKKSLFRKILEKNLLNFAFYADYSSYYENGSRRILKFTKVQETL